MNLPAPPQSLSFDDIKVVFSNMTEGDPLRGFVPGYHFRILDAAETDVGHVNFRVGDTEHVRLAAGHLGFEIAEEHRGHRYAEKACRALAGWIARFDEPVLITVDPGNLPSIRTIERLGAVFLDEVDVPEGDPHFLRGSLRKRRYGREPGVLLAISTGFRDHREPIQPTDRVSFIPPTGPVSGYFLRCEQIAKEFGEYLLDGKHPDGERGVVAWLFRNARARGIQEEHVRDIIGQTVHERPEYLIAIEAATATLSEDEISVASHPPEFEIGQRVAVILNAKNLNPHEGEIHERTWCSAERQWNFVMVENGKRVSRRYLANDLKPL